MNRQQIELPEDQHYRAMVVDLWCHPAVQEMARYLQHGKTTCLSHCICVSYLSYRYCLGHGLNARAAARGGLLHDLFLYDWHTYRPQRGERLHGFSHPGKALENARKYFSLSPVEEDVILRHMWPLTATMPQTPEGRTVTMVDKYVSLLETLRLPVRLERDASWLTGWLLGSRLP